MQKLIFNRKTIYILVVDLLSFDDLEEVYNEMKPYCTKWKFIGIHLGIDINTLNWMERDCRRDEECLREVIKFWLRNTSLRSTRSAMKAALLFVIREGIYY